MSLSPIEGFYTCFPNSVVTHKDNLNHITNPQFQICSATVYIVTIIMCEIHIIMFHTFCTLHYIKQNNSYIGLNMCEWVNNFLSLHNQVQL